MTVVMPHKTDCHMPEIKTLQRRPADGTHPCTRLRRSMCPIRRQWDTHQQVLIAL